MDARRTINDASEECQHCERSRTCYQVGPGFSPDTELIRRMRAMPHYLAEMPHFSRSPWFGLRVRAEARAHLRSLRVTYSGGGL